MKKITIILLSSFLITSYANAGSCPILIKEKLKKDEEKERKKQKEIRINGYNLSDTNNI